jgi:hypothetical protein
VLQIHQSTLSGLAREAVSQCASLPAVAAYNLLLYASCPIGEASSPFVLAFTEEAIQWQAPERPACLFMNHGEFINRSGIAGLDFLIAELQKKSDSNRACLSLVNMSDIVTSGDGPLPSFLLLQFGFPGPGLENIHIGAYLRASELSQHLPINIAEICRCLRIINSHFQDIVSFDLCIHAFRAYVQLDWGCLNRTELDLASSDDISLAVRNQDIRTLSWWIESKLAAETIVVWSGMELLAQELRQSQHLYDSEAVLHAETCVKQLKELHEYRLKRSRARALDDMSSTIRSELQALQKSLGWSKQDGTTGHGPAPATSNGA